jgi:aryl-alcohol dehydrogenase-like predicted oxidoreductase
MKYHTLGPTGLLVSEICLGTMTFSTAEGMWKSISGVEQNLADQLLKQSFDAGVNFVDTADRARAERCGRLARPHYGRSGGVAEASAD